MECKKLRHKVDRYLRGELPSGATDEIERHLERCPDCRAALENARELENVFRQVSTPPVPDDFADEVSRRAAERTEKILGPLPTWRNLSDPWKAAVAASLVVGLAMGFILGGPSQRSRPGDEPEMVETTGLDYLSDSPRGSINRAFVSMISESAAKD
ncbi:MAG: zf-HC2 domain-containing protein [Planctomycetota bacterium]